ncbi:putative lipoprotein [Vibrio nigripulchritudo ATCC 27043]|uniref:ATP-dependent zinc protease family protein n=1 Tax=Vibrio nigripulchritudo TaxID=28173 RepID=UPI00021C3183|nr:ATP-dependent zinc protease [Vibrio nigripulchritudo]EGU56994.1 putative lipoprotein [Vibrio nigripulchritudo ATCC 27043]
MKSSRPIIFLAITGVLSACINIQQGGVPQVVDDAKVSEEKVAGMLKTQDGKLILGEKEWVYISGLDESFKARVDTGATTSSISAVDIDKFKSGGQDYVRFRIAHDGTKSQLLTLPVQRWVRIKQSSKEGYQRRAVVEGEIQIGDLKTSTEFTLADRSHLTFPVLLGRSFFRDVAVVDVSKQYVQKKLN